MSTLPQRQIGLFVTVALAIIGAAVAGIVVFSSGSADEVDLTTAELVPADAAIYIAFNTDLGTSQWLDTFALLERLGEEDAEQQLHDSAEETGEVDWDDVAPFLGGNAAFYMTSFDFDSSLVTGAVIIQTNDADRALEIVEEESGVSLSNDTYREVEFRFDEEVWMAVLGDHLVLAMSEESLFDVIDAWKDGDSLAAVPDFVRLRDELTGNFLGFVYAAPDVLVDDIFGSDGPFGELAGVDFDQEIKPFAGVFGAEGDGFEFQAASVTDGGEVAPALKPRISRFANQVPGETLVFYSTNDVATAWDGAFRALREAVGDLDSGALPVPVPADDRTLDENLDLLEDSLQDADQLVSELTGEFAMAFWSPSGSVNDGEGVIMAEAERPERAIRALENVIRAFADEGPERTTVNGVELNIIGGTLAYAAGDDFIITGSEEGVRTVLRGDSPPLADNFTYTSTVEQMPSALGTYLFVDLAGALRLTEDGIPVDLDEVERALGGMILNAVIERDVVRASGVIRVPGE